MLHPIQPGQGHHPRHRCLDLIPGLPQHPQCKTHILRNTQMRTQRIVLKHGAHRLVFGRQTGDIAAEDGNLTQSWLIKPGNQP